MLVSFITFSQYGLEAQESSSETKLRRDVVDIRPNKQKPPGIKAIAALNESNVIFLDQKGSVGIAKFTPGLALIAWDNYSTVAQDSLASIVPGKNLSVLTAATTELTQAFDTDNNFKLDFFQALATDWPGKKEDVLITAGPVSDGSGRIFFALSPHKVNKEDKAPKATIMSWHPDVKGLQVVTTSMLPVRAMAISPSGVLAARLYMPKYKEGFYVSISKLPPYDSNNPSAEVSIIPSTKPSILIPAELTSNNSPEQLCFIKEDGIEKILVTSPASRQLLEITPEQRGVSWQGAILVREKTASPVETVCFLGTGRVLGGGPDGFFPITQNEDAFRILSVRLVSDGIELRFSKPLNRFTGTSPDRYSVRSTPLQGGGDKGFTIPEPLVESNGKTIILRALGIPVNSVLRLNCMNLTSETGEKLSNPMVFVTIHEK